MPCSVPSHIPPHETGADRPSSVPVTLECSLLQLGLELIDISCLGVFPLKLPLTRLELISLLFPWSVPSHIPSHKTGANWPWSVLLTFLPDNNWSWLAFLSALECSLSRDWSWLAVEWPRNALSRIPPLEIGADRPASVPVSLECSLTHSLSQDRS